MEAKEIMVLAVQGSAVIFTLILFVLLLVGMYNDRKFTADEASKVIVMGILIYMTLVNGNRTTEYPVFGDGTYLILLGAVLILAGIDIYKSKGLLNGNKRPDSKNSK
ncbi:MAG: hypothetical protein JSW41_01935 [Candidatus Aenigmatarchaeota archaeon]|nr:MAG: hypothetical protein JSW41_01935 [Candidatus Aenigmarchaeota archaeon]